MYCSANGKWAYLYRAIDQDGQVVDVYFSERRNAAAQFVYHIAERWPPQAVRWLRRLGGK